jgi:lipid II:glycine glycyltransferase (peptidoglycan interpeptide bridge formation enzyme)
VQIKKSTISELNDWKKVGNNDAIFSSEKWLKLVCLDNYNYQLYSLIEDDQLIGYIPIVSLKGRFLKHISLPYLTPYIDPVFVKKITNDKKQLIANQIAKLLTTDSFYHAFSPEFSNYIDDRNGFETSRTYQLDLRKTEEELFNNLKLDKRRNVKKAKKTELRISLDKNIDDMVSLIEATYSRQNKNIPWLEVAKNIIRNFENSFQVICYDGNVPLAGVYIVFDSYKSYYLFGGYDDAKQNYNAGPFAMWNAILESKKRGKEIFDFEGSEIPEIENYFMRFGGDRKNYITISKKSLKFKLLEKFI